MAKETLKNLRQIIPVMIGSLLGVSFGTMLGWPSATFPLLVDAELSPIPITWDESATIAGFLMEGNIVGTILTSIALIGSKNGVLLSCLCQLAGWITMFFAGDIYGIFASRVLVGIGNGFGTAQLRIYAQESCEEKIYQSLMQYMPLSVNVGLIFTFITGGFASFRILSLVCFVIPLVNIFLFSVIPKHCRQSSSQNLIPAIKTICKCKSSLDVTNVESESNTEFNSNFNNSHLDLLGLCKIFKTTKFRNGFTLLFLITLIPQYSGGATNIVYSQFVHITAQNPHPHLCSVMYSFAFLFSTMVAIEFTNKFPRKPILVGSCMICSLLLCATGLYFYFLNDLLDVSLNFSWSPLLLLSLFNFFHAIGMNMIPVLLISDRFPINHRTMATQTYVICFSFHAIISTKIFQIIFISWQMYMAYAFLSIISFSNGILCLLFYTESKISDIVLNNGICNEVDLSDEMSVVGNKYIVSSQNGDVQENDNEIATYVDYNHTVMNENEITTCKL